MENIFATSHHTTNNQKKEQSKEEKKKTRCKRKAMQNLMYLSLVSFQQRLLLENHKRMRAPEKERNQNRKCRMRESKFLSH